MSTQSNETSEGLLNNPDIDNRTIFEGDNLAVMERINSNSVDLIYLDPPFNTNRIFTSSSSRKKSEARFDDIWGDTASIKGWNDDWILHIETNRLHVKLHSYLATVKSAHSDTMYHYLVYMAVRLVEMERILKTNGSIYFHCDTSAGHYIKPMMDIIFGRNNFKNEIVWNSAPGPKNNVKKKYGRAHDTIFFYSRRGATFNVQYTMPSDAEMEEKFDLEDENGARYFDDSAHIWRSPGMGARPNLCYEWRGFRNRAASGWRLSKEKLEEEYQKGNFVIMANGQLQRRKYLDEYDGIPAQDNWTDIAALGGGDENTGYPTQKPLALLDRIIRASSNEGDAVLDPFAGCATTLVAAEKLNRRWIGIDVEPESVAQLRERLGDVLGLWGVHTHRTDLPKRTDRVEPKVRSDIKDYLYHRQGGTCNGCQRHVPWDLRDIFDLDHIKSRKRGGLDVESNLQLLCRTCNGKKGAGSMAQLLAKLAAEGKR